ncbi:hypothetical protein O3P69_010607 [Scylla paramamosain]|uniref:Uncharacterized protein n=1 Tax=Scylla paramamosain TaxID=85552 RepID=A0AAW0TH55_SCYPA
MAPHKSKRNTTTHSDENQNTPVLENLVRMSETFNILGFPVALQGSTQVYTGGCCRRILGDARWGRTRWNTRPWDT